MGFLLAEVPKMRFMVRESGEDAVEVTVAARDECSLRALFLRWCWAPALWRPAGVGRLALTRAAHRNTKQVQGKRKLY